MSSLIDKSQRFISGQSLTIIQPIFLLLLLTRVLPISERVWEVILKTKRRRLTFYPLESLKITNRGEVNSQEQKIESIQGLKMGLTEMLVEFLENKASFICSLNEHFRNTKSIYFKILNEHVQE